MPFLKILFAVLALHSVTACYTAAVAGAGAGAGYVISEQRDKTDGDRD